MAADVNGSGVLTRYLTLFSICVASFLMPMSLSAVNVALPDVAEDLKIDAVYLSWIPTMNLLGGIAMQLPSGRIADLYGRKRIFILGLLLYFISSAVVVYIEEVEWLLTSRFFQGVAGAMVFSTGMAIVSQVFSQHNRGSALGFIATSVYLGFSCGPLIGGWLTELWGWKSVFLAPLPLVVLSIGLVTLYVREQVQASAEKLDWIGGLLFIFASSVFFFGVTNLSELMGWGALIIGALIFILFVFQQERAPYPLIRFRRVIENRLFIRSLQAALFMYAALYPLQFILSLYLQYIQGLSPVDAGHLMLLQPAVMAVLAPLSGLLSDRYEPKKIATTGCLILAAGFLMLALLDQNSSIEYIGLGLVICGIGFGLFSTPNNNAAMGSIPIERLSIGSSMLSMARTMGNMLGMTVVVLMFNQALGGEVITVESYASLLWVLKYAFILSFVCACLAAVFSFNRGNLRV